MDRISICNLLLKRNENCPFLKWMIIGDEKWVVYNNVQRKRSWGKKDKLPQITSKQNIHAKKVMLCIWWDCKGIMYYELLSQNQTINSEKYPNWTVWSSNRRKVQNCQIVMVSCFIKTTRPYLFDNTAKITVVWLECLALFAWYCIIKFSFI